MFYMDMFYTIAFETQNLYSECYFMVFSVKVAIFKRILFVEYVCDTSDTRYAFHYQNRSLVDVYVL